MKTLNNYFGNALLITVLTISAFTLNAQNDIENESAIVQLDTVSINGNYASFEKMATNIATSTNFKYRKALRKAKASKNVYVFSERQISEVAILKYFKKAARIADTVDDFRNYFYERDLSFIEALDGKTINNIYLRIRPATFNGYLDDLEQAFGSVY
ncbi:MAG: hypothetical protein Q8O62_14300 [Aequorivita sp.]|nr:hypothetical protein [Aequorivita sp.]